MIGAVWRAAPFRNLFVPFSELLLSTVVNFSLANLTNEFVICSVANNVQWYHILL